jgi:hypothetical protein
MTQRNTFLVTSTNVTKLSWAISYVNVELKTNVGFNSTLAQLIACEYFITFMSHEVSNLT